MEKTFKQEIDCMIDGVTWNLRYRIPKVIKMFNKRCTLQKITEYKNIIIMREASGREILIINFDSNSQYKSFDEIKKLYSLFYYIILCACDKYKLNFNFESIEDLDAKDLPCAVRDYIIHKIDVNKHIVSNPPMATDRFYFYCIL